MGFGFINVPGASKAELDSVRNLAQAAMNVASTIYQGTGVTGTSATGTAFPGSGVSQAKVNDMYLNTSTGNIYTCTAGGAASGAKWAYTGCLMGPQGKTGATGATGPGGANGSDGAAAGFGNVTATVDNNTGMPSVSVTASGSNAAKNFAFEFKNLKGPTGGKGATGARGSLIYQGTAITGTSTTATIFSSSGVSSALVNDVYINTTTWNLYQCTTAGAADTAKWAYKGCLQGATGATGPAGSDATIPYLKGSGTATANIACDSVALGNGANASGVWSIALGCNASASDDYSVALGNSASASAAHAIALGRETKASGHGSVALGLKAVANNTWSTALGSGSIAASGDSTAIGAYANVSGIHSTALGYSTNASGGNSTALGYGAETSNESSIQIGNASSLSSITAKVAITVTSDERDKADVTEIADGATEFMKKIKAVTFVYNQRELYRPKEPERDENGQPIYEDGVDYLTEADHENLAKYGFCRYDEAAHKAGGLKGSRRRVGLLAQQVQAALKEVYGSASYANLVNDNLYDFENVPEGIESTLAMNYEGFTPFLIKAIQELDSRISDLEAAAHA